MYSIQSLQKHLRAVKAAQILIIIQLLVENILVSSDINRKLKKRKKRASTSSGLGSNYIWQQNYIVE